MFAYKSVYCFYNFGFALEFQWTLGDKHQQEKLPCMLCYRLACIYSTLFHMNHAKSKYSIRK